MSNRRPELRQKRATHGALSSHFGGTRRVRLAGAPQRRPTHELFEVPLGHLPAVFVRHVGRREEVDARGHLVELAVERVAEPAGEVDEAAQQVAVDLLRGS